MYNNNNSLESNANEKQNNSKANSIDRQPNNLEIIQENQYLINSINDPQEPQESQEVNLSNKSVHWFDNWENDIESPISIHESLNSIEKSTIENTAQIEKKTNKLKGDKKNLVPSIWLDGNSDNHLDENFNENFYKNNDENMNKMHTSGVSFELNRKSNKTISNFQKTQNKNQYNKSINNSMNPFISRKSSFHRSLDSFISSKKRKVKDASLSFISILNRNKTNREILGIKFNQLESDEKSDIFFRRQSLILAIFATLGIFLMVTTNFICFDFLESGEYYSLEIIGLPTRLNYRVYIYYFFKLLNLFNTWICLGLLIPFYKKKAEVEKKLWSFSNNIMAFFYSRLWKGFLIELILISYTPVLPFPYAWFGKYPNINSNPECYNQSFVYSWLQCNEGMKRYYNIMGLSDKFGIIMFIRLYLWIRVLRDYSAVYKNRRLLTLEFSKKGLPVPSFGWKLIIRMIFTKYPFICTFFTVSILFLIMSFSLWIVERGINDRFRILSLDEINILWFIGASMLSTGYGDVLPETYIGKVIGIISAYFGSLLVTMLTAQMVRTIYPSPSLINANNYLKIDEINNKRFIQALRWIQVNWLYKKRKCSFKYMFKTKQSAIKKMNKYKRKSIEIENVLKEVQKEYRIEQIEKENDKLDKQFTNLQRELNLLTNTLEPIISSYEKKQGKNEMKQEGNNEI